MAVIEKKLLDELDGRLRWCEADRQGYEDEWEEALNFYVGDQWTDSPVTVQDPLVVNKFWPLVQAAIPNLFFRAPYAYVRPTQAFRMQQTLTGQPVMPDAEANARSAEAVSNRFWRDRRMRWMMRMLLVDAHVMSIGWVKTGFSSEHGIPAEDQLKSEMDPELLEAMQSVFPGMSDEDVMRLSGRGHLLDFDSSIAPGHAWAKRVSPMDIWVDPDAYELEDARFLIHRVRRQLRSVKADPMYEGTRDLEPTEMVTAEAVTDMAAKGSTYPRLEGLKPHYRTNESDQPSVNDPVESIDLFEYWDRERRAVYTLVRQGPKGMKCIRKLETWPYAEIRDFPFKALRLNCIPDRFYPFTAIHHWVEQQKELNLYRSIQADHARRMGRKVFAEEDFFASQEEEAKMESPGAGSIIKVKPGKAEKGWKPVEMGSIPPDLFRTEIAVKQDIGEATLYGASPNAMGQPNPRTTSATESAVMAESIGSITDDQLTVVSDFAADLTRDLFLIHRQFWTAEEMIMHTSPHQGQHWVQVSPDKLRGHFDFVIEVGATQKESHELRQRQSMQLLQILGAPQFFEAFGPEVIKNMVIRLLRAFQIDYPDQLFAAAQEWVPPTQRAQMENALQKEATPRVSVAAGGGQTGPASGTMQPNQSGGGMTSRGPEQPGQAGGGDLAAALQSQFGGMR